MGKATLPMACLLGLRDVWSRAIVVFGVAFLPAYYLREFESYGVFYVPLYALAALAIVALTWAPPRLWQLITRR